MVGASQFTSRLDSESGVRFGFKYDPDDPAVLHIFARHGTTAEDAIRTFRSGTTRWNEKRQRFETTTDTHSLLWYWIEEGRVVMVVSCFGRSEFTWTSG